jgi:hypothetical protein
MALAGCSGYWDNRTFLSREARVKSYVCDHCYLITQTDTSGAVLSAYLTGTEQTTEHGFQMELGAPGEEFDWVSSDVRVLSATNYAIARNMPTISTVVETFTRPNGLGQGNNEIRELAQGTTLVITSTTSAPIGLMSDLSTAQEDHYNLSDSTPLRLSN